MTISELYENAKKTKSEHYEIQLQCQDGGGVYQGSITMEDFEIHDGIKEVVLY